jgi:hypothetical protein
MPPGRLHKLTNVDRLLTSINDHGCVLPMQSATQGDICSSLKELDLGGCVNDERKRAVQKVNVSNFVKATATLSTNPR